MERTGVVALIGNGLSIAVNPELQLDRLTTSFLEGHSDDRELIKRLVDGVHLGPVDSERDFEGIVAGLQSAEEVLAAFMHLAEAVDHPDIREAARVLNEHHVPALIRRLYYAYCAEVLAAIGQLAKADIPDEVMQFGDWLKSQHDQHDWLSIFTLNYDVLMERMLVGPEFLGLRRQTTDFFSGLEERQMPLELYPGCIEVNGHLFYPQDPPPDRTIQLHHLHGCLTHFRAPDGNIYKIPSGLLNALNVYEKLAAGAGGDYVPSVILGSRKAERAKEWPFSHAFLALEADIAQARTVCIAGYSFRDEAVNDRLRPALAGVERLIVCDYAPGRAERQVFTQRVEAALRPAKTLSHIEWHLDGFAAGAPAELAADRRSSTRVS